MSFLSRLFRINTDDKVIKNAHDRGYKDGIAVGIKIGNKEGETRGWKEAMSKIANLADEMTIKKD